MQPIKITSAQHPIVKRFVKLCQDKSFRREEKSVVIVGGRLVKEISCHFKLKTLIIDHAFPEVSAEKTFLATPEVLKKITSLAKPDGVAAEIDLPEQKTLNGKKFLLVLDRISDPGNLGTLLRTALALGWEGVFLTPHAADPFNDKALRAAKGACFFLPIHEGTYEELDLLIKEENMTVYVADLEGKPLHSLEVRPPLALILGNESQGPSSWAKQHGSALSIPMGDTVESLNVASAGAILMYELKRKI
jgi:TrmH family RNA methyltransferase